MLMGFLNADLPLSDLVAYVLGAIRSTYCTSSVGSVDLAMDKSIE